MKYLIVTADDLGLAESINEGIAKACSEGIVKAISIIPAGEAFEDAIYIARKLPFKDVGAHLALSEIKPVLSDSKSYKNHNELFFTLMSGKVDTADIYKELKAQIEIIKKSGLKVTHINSHEHIHIIPQILDIFIKLAKEYDIPAIRFPRGDRQPNILSIKENYKSFLMNYFAGRIKNNMDNSGLAHTDFFVGLLDAGKLDIDKIKKMIGSLKEGVTELVTHPGFLSPEVLNCYSWHKNCEAELFALTDKHVKTVIKDNNVKLISYEEFLVLKKMCF